MIHKIIRFFLIVMGVIIFFLALTVFYQYKELRYNRLFSGVNSTVETGIHNLGFDVLKRELKQEGLFPSRKVGEIRVLIPREYPLDQLIKKIKENFSSSNCKILNLQEENLKDIYQIKVELGFEKIKTHQLSFSLKKAKIALLIDDFGYSDDQNLLNAFFEELDFPFTISIIPGTPFAQEVARKAHLAGKEIILHLPMQPEGAFKNQYKWIVMEKMSEEKIRQTVREAIESVPYVEGLNNHMGSLVTTREDIMRPVLEVLKEKEMFFVDSKTSSRSIAYSLAQKLRVKSTFRTIFLDNQKKQTYIEHQFNQLLSLTKNKDKVLGLGHADLETASALAELTRKCDYRKFSFVFISEIVD